MNQYILAFLTGLTTGGVSCFAVQGSLLTSVIVTSEEKKLTSNLKTKNLLLFLISKIIAYTILGFFLGILGEKIIVGPKLQGWFQLLIGIFMILTAANLAGIHPFFRRFVITPPKFIFKFLRKESRVDSFFTPILLGAMTILIPCGVTQAMMLLAVSAGNPLVSSLILFFFTLGTSPVFFAIGYAATELFKHKAFATVAAAVVAVFGLISINSGQVLRGSPHTFQNYSRVIFASSEKSTGGLPPVTDGAQNVTININSRGYTSDTKKIKLGIPVKLTLISNSAAGCSRAFTIPDYNISEVLPVTGSKTVEFTPTKVGQLTYTCSMGMYTGYFDIIN